MTNFIPIFPLGVVVFPGEQLNLHIFEPRYKQLIHDCFSENRSFGIPIVLKNNVSEMGTLVTITEIVQVHEDGKMDIRTRGEKVFRMLELVKTIPEKLYSGAIVHYPDNDERQNSKLAAQVIAGIRELHKLIQVSKDFKKPDDELCSYDLAHHAGLSLEEEYELLGLLHESQRLEYLKQHLSKVLPVVAGMESLKERIQLNGHFRELKGFNFDL
ncbi:MAG: LON peptidase substrate-binding domain-containing protein [Sediminibacterium sp.]|uniref:LON peptidase substrate-binding domain-containing protein n=1 Tax=Sediminibacterium sp. TaxID=1917865 RepID=UPI003F6E8E82